MRHPTEVVRAQRIALETPGQAPVPAILSDLGCPPLALRLIEAMVAAKFQPAGRVELHVTRDDLRAMLGAFAITYEEARGRG